MDAYIRALKLDLNAQNNHQFVKAKQGDLTLRKLAISILQDGVMFAPSGVAKYVFRCAKPDGTAVVLEGTGSAAPIEAAQSTGTYTVTLSEQCLAVAGRVICDFAMMDSSDNVLSSADFILDVVPMPDIGNLVRSSTEWERLNAAIEDAERFSQILAFRENGGYIQYTIDGTTWVNLCQLSSIITSITDAQIDALFE